MILRVIWHVFTVEARKRMTYRADFWINSLGGLLVHLSVYWALTVAMFHSSGQPTIGGYSQQGMLLYYMFVTLTSRIVQTGELDMTTATDIYEGLLSRYLLYPVPYPVLKYAQALGALAPLMLQLVVFGSVAPLFFRDGADARISIASILMFAISIFLANLLHFILMLPIQSVAFWADNVWSLAVAMRFLTTLCGGLMLPLELFPAWARPIVEASPFPYLFYTPARVLLGNASPSEWVIGLAIAAAWCVVLTIILRWVWRRGELEYTGVGI